MAESDDRERFDDAVRYAINADRQNAAKWKPLQQWFENVLGVPPGVVGAKLLTDSKQLSNRLKKELAQLSPRYIVLCDIGDNFDTDDVLRHLREAFLPRARCALLLKGVEPQRILVYEHDAVVDALLGRFPELSAEHVERPGGFENLPETEQPPETLAELADELLLTPEFLNDVLRMLSQRGQVIFYGPPGTGKTYVARALARFVAGGDERVRLVQFHPSYTYEDFVEGYRPILRDDSAGFVLKPGPLKTIARAAREHPDLQYVLIIDEINRGALASIFGELYFLLEYRNEDALLLYSGEPLALPTNLWIVGTMNTADRSIALVDAALRRRFYFFGFFPDEPPIDALLARWLHANKPELSWLADLVRVANERIGDRNGCIGPSYFMRSDLDEEWARLIWEHSVIPYLEEQFFGDDERLAEFNFAALCKETPTAPGLG